MPTNTGFASLHILIEANLLDDLEGISLPQAFVFSMKYSSYTMYTFNISPEKETHIVPSFFGKTAKWWHWDSIVYLLSTNFIGNRLELTVCL